MRCPKRRYLEVVTIPSLHGFCASLHELTLYGDFHRIIVAGDGRYYNNEAMQIIARILAGNGVSNIWIPVGGIMSTPAVSAAIRTREGGVCEGGIVLTASHNPGGPGEDFGIKYNLAYGQPAGEDFTDDLYERSLNIKSFKTVDDYMNIDLNAPIGTTYQLGSALVTIIDPFAEYVAVLKECFDFDALSIFLKDRPDFSVVFDGMHGAGGPFARRVLLEELGLPEVSSLHSVLVLLSFFLSFSSFVPMVNPGERVRF
jgi:phosphoglucomutase